MRMSGGTGGTFCVDLLTGKCGDVDECNLDCDCPTGKICAKDTCCGNNICVDTRTCGNGMSPSRLFRKDAGVLDTELLSL